LTALPTDPSRVLREYALEPLRREMRAAGTRVLVVRGARDAAELTGTSARFDAAWIELDSLLGIDVASLGREVGRVLRPGGRLVCVVPGARPLRRVLRRAFRGLEDSGGGSYGNGRPRATFSGWRRAFEPSVVWGRARSFGLLVPPAPEWASLHPLMLGLLAGLEHAVGRWPLARALGDHVLHEGVRR
jgi:SAM-dependent methyltransferase